MLIEGFEEFYEPEVCPYAEATRRSMAMGSAALLAAIKGEKPKPVKFLPPPPKPADGRLATLAVCRANQINLRNKKAVRAGPIAREIIDRVAQWFDLGADVVLGPSRRKYHVSARYVAMRLLADVVGSDGTSKFSRAQIGRIIGGRDHSTVLHALDIFDDRARLHTEMAEAYGELKA